MELKILKKKGSTVNHTVKNLVLILLNTVTNTATPDPLPVILLSMPLHKF